MGDIIALFIPMVAIVMGVGAGMLSIYLNYRKRKDMFALYHQQRMAAIEKGIELPDLPEDFFREEGTPSRGSPHRTLLGGLILLFTGLTLYPALYFTVRNTEAGSAPALFALIPAGIGVACLIFYFTVGQKVARAMEEERKTRLADAARGRNAPA